MRKLLLIGFLGILLQTSAQQNLLPLHSFYKDQLFGKTLPKTGFLPANESDFDLINAINDSSPQYYTVTDILFKKHLIEIHGEDVYLTISPAANISYGKDFGDTNERNITHNMRGIFVEGDFFKNFSFSTAFYENQSRFMRYETDYYTSLGERYVVNDSTFSTQNAVVPGAGRTKPFKEDGFDYAYATGYFVYVPISSVKIAAGNNPQFIGAGHRSIFLSDNSYNAPYFKVDWNFASKWSFSYMRSRHLNLFRRPEGSTAENYYEPTGYSVNYLTYNPTEKWSISLFEGGVWNRGDSVESRFSHPLYYNPVPFVSALALDGKNEVSALIGINLMGKISENHMIYAQVGLNNLNSDKLAYQVGYRGYQLFGVTPLMLQLEYNHVNSGFDQNPNSRLNYSHYNLPLGHVKGSGFDEFILRSSYEYKRVYGQLTSVVYALNDFSPVAHLIDGAEAVKSDGTIIYSNIEVGYRFNRKMNLSIFTSYTYRSDSNSSDQPINAVNFGMKTALTNHYKDF